MFYSKFRSLLHDENGNVSVDRSTWLPCDQLASLNRCSLDPFM